MTIGDLTMPSGAALAPMAGVTDRPFRRICHELGAAYAVSEMLSAKGYLFAPHEPRAVTELLALGADEGIVGLQLFGHEPEVVAEAARRLEGRGFQFIDLNMGCPAQKIVSGGDGSALMKRPALAGEIVAAAVRAVKLPVTVKIRAGWDERHKNAVEIARIAEDSGAAAITVHGRTREQFYTGKADWSVIAGVVQAVKIPVIGNGDVSGADDALRMRRETGCAAVAVGRAACGNPWIFREIAAALAGEACAPVTFADRVKMAIRHYDDETELRGDLSAMLEMRKHLSWYLSGQPGCAKLRAHINALNDPGAVRRALTALLSPNTRMMKGQ